MIGQRIRNWLGGPIGGSATAEPELARAPMVVVETADHRSRGLQESLGAVNAGRALSVLDLGDINQENVGYITGLGHRHFSEDMLASMDAVLGGREFGEDGPPADRVREFLAGSLQFPDQAFDAVFAWDTLQFLPPAILDATIQRLMSVLRPGGVMFSIFHGGPRHAPVAANSFRIVDPVTLRVVPKYWRQPAQAFNNRSLEKLFEDWRSIKFFLTHDSLKEVISRR